jgi:PAS domain S-box-containing protein
MEKPREPSEVANEGRNCTQGSSDLGRLKATLDALDEGFFEVDLGGRFLASNRAMERLLGLPEGGLLNRDYRDVLAPESAASLHAVFRKVYLTGASLKLATLEVTRADGTRRFLQISARLNHDSTGEPSGLSGMARDVTEIEENRAMAGASLDCQPFQMALLDADGTIRVVNKAWESSPYGKPGGWECAPGSNYLAALSSSVDSGDSYSALEAEGIRAVLEGRREQFTFESPTREGEQVRWYLLVVSPLYEDARISGVLLSRMDITTRKLSEQELTTLYKAMDSSVDGLALLEPDGTFLYMNPAFAHIHAFDAPVELAGKRWSDLYSELQWSFIEKEVLPHVNRFGYWTGELVGKGGGGAFYQSVSLTQLEQGRVIVCSIRDISHQKKIENDLKESELKFRTIYNNVTEGILVLDPIGPCVVAANAAICRMFGYESFDEIKDLDVLDFVAESDRTRVAEDLRRVIQEDYHRLVRYECVRRDGRRIWVEALGTKTDYAGRVVDLIAMRDVTEKVEAEVALQTSEARSRAILDSARDAIYIKDRKFRYVLGNPAMADLLGIAESEIAGMTDLDLFGAEVGQLIRRVDERVLAGEMVELEEETVQTGAGRRVFNTVKVPLRGPKDSIVGICGISRDVTDHVIARRKLEDSERRFRHIVENVPDFYFYVHDRDRNYSYISPGVETVTGYPPEYFLAPHPCIGTENPINEKAERISGLIFDERLEPPPYFVEIRHKSGRIIRLEAFERPILKDGVVVEVMGLCHEVTGKQGSETSEKNGKERYGRDADV